MLRPIGLPPLIRKKMIHKQDMRYIYYFIMFWKGLLLFFIRFSKIVKSVILLYNIFNNI